MMPFESSSRVAYKAEQIFVGFVRFSRWVDYGINSTYTVHVHLSDWCILFKKLPGKKKAWILTVHIFSVDLS